MEIELKLALPPGTAARVRAHPALAGVVQGRARRQRLVATYYDTSDARLAARGIALRVRREGRRWVQTLKGPPTPASGGGLAARPEHDWPLGAGARRPAPDLARLDEVPLGKAVARLGRRQPLVPLFATEFERTTLPLAFPDGTTALAAIDVGQVRTLGARRRRAAIGELELELGEGDPARLFELAQVLADDPGLRLQLRSKAERGYALAFATTRTPVHAEAIDYPRDAVLADALAAIVRSCLRQVEGNLDSVAGNDDPEWIHQLRVGVRRLRSALALARPLLADGAVEPLAADLRWLAGALGPARDLDVFATQTWPAVLGAAAQAPAAAAGVDAALAVLGERLAARLPQARARARSAMRSPRVQRVLLAGGALAARMPALVRAADAAEGHGPEARDAARKALARRHRRLLRAGEGLAACTPEERHAFRIAAKKLRYATEFFAPCFPAGRSRRYRKALVALQDVLGRLNDAAVAASLAADLASPDPRAVPAAALVAGWAAARVQAEAPALDRAWTRFRRAAAFWSP